MLNRAGQDQVTVKPWPKEYDQWQQHYHGPDNNAVAHDTAVGPPRHYQWIAFPEWQRSHHIMPSMNSLLASQSRLYTVEDVASADISGPAGQVSRSSAAMHFPASSSGGCPSPTGIRR